MAESKPLAHDDSSGFDFVKEMLDGDPTYAINFDRLQKHPKHGYIIFEFLLCEESQPNVTPFTSHPSKYWHKNSTKFIKLWEVANELKSHLFLVNYAKKGTKHENEVLLIKVKKMENYGITDEKVIKFTRAKFQQCFKKLNEECKN